MNVLSGKIKCGDCGSWYGSKVWHSNDKYHRVIWQCNHKFDGGTKCTTPHLDEDIIKRFFIKALNILCKECDLIIAGFEEIKDTAFSTDALEAEADVLNGEVNTVAELIQKCIDEDACVAQDQSEYQKRYDALVQRFETTKAKLDETQSAIARTRAAFPSVSCRLTARNLISDAVTGKIDVRDIKIPEYEYVDEEADSGAEDAEPEETSEEAECEE